MLDWIGNQLEDIQKSGLLRKTVPARPAGPGSLLVNGKVLRDFASNDYLGFSHRHELIEAAKDAAEKWGCGSRASRLMSGTLSLVERLEDEAARFQGTEASLCLGNGYIANTTIIPALVGRKDAIFMDRLCHASIVDGVLLSGVRFFRFSHNDVDHLEELLLEHGAKFRRTLIIVESLYSMDGDIAPLPGILKLAEKHGSILMVDEAHALGVFGENGEGIISKDTERKPDIIIGTFGKALGSYGAFAACQAELKRYLVNMCRGFIFSTALPPPVIGANLKALEILPRQGAIGKTVLELASRLRGFIKGRLKRPSPGSSQIVPLILDSIEETLELERFLLENGIFTRSIRPPTVPKNSPRIRFSITADHGQEDIDRLEALLERFFHKG
jgi:8-amino-7-oxononanoate synthase